MKARIPKAYKELNDVHEKTNKELVESICQKFVIWKLQQQIKIKINSQIRGSMMLLVRSIIKSHSFLNWTKCAHSLWYNYGVPNSLYKPFIFTMFCNNIDLNLLNSQCHMYHFDLELRRVWVIVLFPSYRILVVHLL